MHVHAIAVSSHSIRSTACGLAIKFTIDIVARAQLQRVRSRPHAPAQRQRI